MSPGPRPSSHDGTQRPGLHWVSLSPGAGAAQILTLTTNLVPSPNYFLFKHTHVVSLQAERLIINVSFEGRRWSHHAGDLVT